MPRFRYTSEFYEDAVGLKLSAAATSIRAALVGVGAVFVIGSCSEFSGNTVGTV